MFWEFLSSDAQNILFFFSEACQVEQKDKAELLSAVSDNLFVDLHEEFSSSYKIQKYVMNSGNYISPVSIKLSPPADGGQGRTFQYIPLTELVPAIVSQPGFGSATNCPKAPNNDVLQDVKDGTAYQNSQYFKVGLLLPFL